MMNTFLKYAVATALVLGCSIDAHAQSRPQHVPQGSTTIINNNTAYGGGGYRGGNYGGYTYSGYGNYTYNNNCTGCYPGSGPYDSSIAVAGITAGAAVLGALIGSTANRQPAYPQGQVIVQQPQQVYVQQPQTVVVTPNNCRSWITGYGNNGQPIYLSTCN